MKSEIPIYLQLRNQIVKGIGKGEFEEGENAKLEGIIKDTKENPEEVLINSETEEELIKKIKELLNSMTQSRLLNLLSLMMLLFL